MIYARWCWPLVVGLAPRLAGSRGGAGARSPDGTVREGTLSFDARASAGNFTGTTTRVTGEMMGGELADVRGWVEAPVRTLRPATRGEIAI